LPIWLDGKTIFLFPDENAAAAAAAANHSHEESVRSSTSKMDGDLMTLKIKLATAQLIHQQADK
jgi:hypothetical protein